MIENFECETFAVSSDSVAQLSRPTLEQYREGCRRGNRFCKSVSVRLTSFCSALGGVYSLVLR